MKRLFNIFLVAAMLAVTVTTVGIPTSTAHAAPLLSTPNSWNALGSGIGNGQVRAIAINGTDIYAAGTFTDVDGNTNAARIAKWNGSAWSALGSGISNGQVNSLAFNGSNLYVGGSFTSAGGVSGADNIAEWNGSSWSTLGNGLTGAVNAIAVNGSNIYMAGSFLNAGGDGNADYIAKLDGGAWEAVGTSPLNNAIHAIAVAGSTVYAGGDFTGRISMWDGSTWTTLGSGLNNSVYAVTLVDSDLYVGGLFSDAGGNGSADRIAKWDGSSWSALASGVGVGGSVVYTIVASGSSLYVSGDFINAGNDATADYIVRWNGSSWSALGATPLNTTVRTLLINGLDLYAGGAFTDAGGNANADRIARFESDIIAPVMTSFTALSPSPSVDIPITAFTASDDAAIAGYLINESGIAPASSDAGWTTSAPTAYTVGSDGSYTLYPWVKDTSGNVSAVYGSPLNVSVDTTPPTISANTWNPLGSGLSNIPYDLAISGSDLYAVGSFLDAGSYKNADRAAKWNGTSWSPLGGGLNGQVKTVVVDGSLVYAGGTFNDAGGNSSADFIAQWNGSNWSAVGTGMNGTVNSIAASGSNIYVAGGFYDVGGNANADYIVKLNGGTWQSLGTTPLSSDAYAVAVDGSDVYVGGDFQDAGGDASADRIAKWNGTSWSALGSGLNGNVYTIILYNGELYAGGVFTSANRIAKWNGTSWSALGSGLNGTVYAIAASGTDIYAAGAFTDAGGDVNADYIAKWDGSSWSALGSTPLNGIVYGIAVNGSKIYASGSFTDAGGNSNADRIAMFMVDAAPAVTSFTVPSLSASFDVSITEFTASDNMAVTAYLITESPTPPSAGDAGWTGSAPTTYTVSSDGSYTLYPWAKDASGSVSAVYGSPASVTVDTTAPTVTSFTANSSSTTLNIPISSFTASDAVAVTGYLITESATQPSAGAAGWTASAPTTFTVASQGSYTLYPWAMDAAGNVSAVYGSPVSVSVDNAAPNVVSIERASTNPTGAASVNFAVTFSESVTGADTGDFSLIMTGVSSASISDVTGSGATRTVSVNTGSGDGSIRLDLLNNNSIQDSVGNSLSGSFTSGQSYTVDKTAPTVTAFSVPSTSASLNIPITTFSSSDNMGVTDYLITESDTQPASGDSGWSATAPTTYTVASDGNYTLYPWAKDAAGNVSSVYGSPASVEVDTTSPGDTTAPSVDTFTTASTSNSLNISITAFTASDNTAVTGYLITESATSPSVGSAGWTATAPTTYPVPSMGSYTLYPWAKDAAGHVSALYASPASVNITCLTPITVMNNNDSGPGSLRQAIADVCMGDINNISMIDFDSALSGGTIHLASTLTIAKTVTIDGSDLVEPLTISGENNVRVFSITSPAFINTLDSLIITKGATSGDGAGLFIDDGMHVTIQNSTFSDNHAGGNGGGIFNEGGLTLIDSTIAGNSAAGGNGGGGIQNSSGITITNSTISNNTATGVVASGGGMANNGGATITNSTFFGNSSSVYGGGISTTANLTITNSTIAGNSAAVTGGLQVDGNVTHLRNTIIANNTSATINSLIHNDCSDTSDYPSQPTPDGDGIMTNINNLIEDGSCSPSVSGDPNLGPLADNVGPTQTMALMAGSSAIDAGDDTICAGTTNPNPVNSLDQRGVARPLGSHCDIGAYEFDVAYIDVTINGSLTGAHTLGVSQSARVSYAHNNGPVKVSSPNAKPFVVAERDAWLLNGVVQSFSEMMGLPANQVTDTYYFPWYNNVTMDTQLRFANLGAVPTDITVTIAGVAQLPITVAAGQSARVSYPGINAGPVKVQSSGGTPIIVAERDAWLINGVVQSFSEMMGLPGNQLTDTYYFPWYNNVTMDTQLRFANLGNTSTDITVTIAGVAQQPITVAAGQSTRVSYPVNNGPVKVQSTGGVPIIVAERDAWLINGVVRSFSEMMGLPANQLTDTYYFPWYNNVTMDTQLRFANLGNTSTNITVTIAGVAQPPITVAAGMSTRISYAGINNGPVKVTSSGGVPIIVAERDAWLLNGAVRSFSEMMGLPGNQLTTTYYFPWYNNLTMDTQLRFALP